MKKLSVFLFIAMGVLFSCTKEKSIENDGKVINSALLIKMVTASGSDSLVISFGYDGSNRLTTYSTAESFQGNSSNSQTSFKRNNDGIIQQVILEGSLLGSNDIVYDVNYSTTDSRYTSAIRTSQASGTQVKDSIAYSYDGSGKIIKQEDFVDAGITGGYAEASKDEYTYDGNGNISKEMSYEYDAATGKYNLTSETSFEYDAKVNPLKLSIEALFLDAPEMTSGSNTTKKVVKDYTDPTLGDTISTTYAYNQSDKPDTATVTYQSLGVPLTTKYFYQ